MNGVLNSSLCVFFSALSSVYGLRPRTDEEEKEEEDEDDDDYDDDYDDKEKQSAERSNCFVVNCLGLVLYPILNKSRCLFWLSFFIPLGCYS